MSLIPHPPADAADNYDRLVTSNFIDRSATVKIVERLPFTTVTFTNEATSFVPPAALYPDQG